MIFSRFFKINIIHKLFYSAILTNDQVKLLGQWTVSGNLLRISRFRGPGNSYTRTIGVLPAPDPFTWPQNLTERIMPFSHVGSVSDHNLPQNVYKTLSSSNKDIKVIVSRIVWVLWLSKSCNTSTGREFSPKAFTAGSYPCVYLGYILPHPWC